MSSVGGLPLSWGSVLLHWEAFGPEGVVCVENCRLRRSPGPAHSRLRLRGKLYTSHHFLHHLHSHLHQSACIMNQSEIFHVFKFSQIIIFYKLFLSLCPLPKPSFFFSATSQQVQNPASPQSGLSPWRCDGIERAVSSALLAV